MHVAHAGQPLQLRLERVGQIRQHTHVYPDCAMQRSPLHMPLVANASLVARQNEEYTRRLAGCVDLLCNASLRSVVCQYGVQVSRGKAMHAGDTMCAATT